MGPGCKYCYAWEKNHYKFENVTNALLVRTLWARQACADGTFVRDMCRAIKDYTDSTYLRMYSSGDFEDPRRIECWVEVAGECGEKKFWFPTRTWQRMDDPLWARPLLKLAGLPNVRVSPSALDIDDPPPEVEGLAPGSTVVREASTAAEFGCTVFCPKSQQTKATCLSCKCLECWNKLGRPVAYLLHGENKHHIKAFSRKDLKRLRRKLRQFRNWGPFDVSIQWPNGR